MSSTVGVFGCGWLGTPLAKRLIAKGYRVKGTTTSSEKLQALEDMGILPYRLKLTLNGIEGDVTDFLAHLDLVIINIPPGLRKKPTESFVKRMELLISELESSNIKNILFVGSTSVYGNVAGEITEGTIPNPVSESGKQLLQVENLLRSNSLFNTTVLRFGGLIGPKRHPINHLAGKTNLKNGEELVNLIHLDDCILMIETIIKKSYWNLIFNGVFPHHPTKEDYYTDQALKRGLPPPKFVAGDGKTQKKRIKSHLFYVKNHRLLTTITS